MLTHTNTENLTFKGGFIMFSICMWFLACVYITEYMVPPNWMTGDVPVAIWPAAGLFFIGLVICGDYRKSDYFYQTHTSIAYS